MHSNNTNRQSLVWANRAESCVCNLPRLAQHWNILIKAQAQDGHSKNKTQIRSEINWKSTEIIVLSTSDSVVSHLLYAVKLVHTNTESSFSALPLLAGHSACKKLIHMTTVLQISITGFKGHTKCIHVCMQLYFFPLQSYHDLANYITKLHHCLQWRLIWLLQNTMNPSSWYCNSKYCMARLTGHHRSVANNFT